MPRQGYRPMYGMVPMQFSLPVAGGAPVWVPAPFYANGGAADRFMASGETGLGDAQLNVTNTKKGTFIAKIKPNSVSVEQRVFTNSSVRFSFEIESNGAVTIQCSSAEVGPPYTTQELFVKSTAGALTAGVWNWVLCSWDSTGAAAGSATNMALWVNGSNVLDTPTAKYVAGNQVLAYERVSLDCTDCDTALFATTSGSTPYAGCVEMLAFCANVDLQFNASAANRSAIVDGSGNLTHPGTNGVNWFGAGSDVGLLVYDANYDGTITNHVGKNFIGTGGNSATFDLFTGGTDAIACP